MQPGVRGRAHGRGVPAGRRMAADERRRRRHQRTWRKRKWRRRPAAVRRRGVQPYPYYGPKAEAGTPTACAARARSNCTGPGHGAGGGGGGEGTRGRGADEASMMSALAGPLAVAVHGAMGGANALFLLYRGVPGEVLSADCGGRGGVLRRVGGGAGAGQGRCRGGCMTATWTTGGVLLVGYGVATTNGTKVRAGGGERREWGRGGCRCFVRRHHQIIQAHLLDLPIAIGVDVFESFPKEAVRVEVAAVDVHGVHTLCIVQLDISRRSRSKPRHGSRSSDNQ